MSARLLPIARATLLAAFAFLLAVAAWAQPDLRQMAGQAMPSGDLPAGTISIRVVRQTLAANAAGIAVELHGAGAVRTGTTGDDGRATFSGVAPGASVHATAVVDGERLETVEIVMPADAGVRALLVAGVGAGQAGAGDAGASPPGAPPAAAAPVPPGDGPPVSLGANTRFAIEFGDDGLQVFYLLEIVNRTGAPYSPASALVFEMPPGAEGTAVLEGATVTGDARGRIVSAAGPFPAGVSTLPMAFRLDTTWSSRTLDLTFPLPLESADLFVQKVGDLQVKSAQLSAQREVPIQGSPFIVATGPALAAGAPLRVELTGIPHHSRLPAYGALTLAGLILAMALWVAARRPSGEPIAARRAELERRRERGLESLAALDLQHRQGGVSEAAWSARRAELVRTLERIYGELDRQGGVPEDGRGLAA